MPISPCYTTLSKPLSFIGFLGCAGYALQKADIQSGNITMDSATILILLLLFTLAFYSTYVMKCSTILSSDLATLLRGAVSVLYTTSLFTKEGIIGGTWDYLPSVIMVTISIIYIMQSDCECDRSFMPLYLIVNFFAQVFVAFKSDKLIVAAAGLLLCLIQNICQESMYFGLGADAWFNMLAASYCLAISAGDGGK